MEIANPAWKGACYSADHTRGRTRHSPSCTYKHKYLGEGFGASRNMDGGEKLWVGGGERPAFGGRRAWGTSSTNRGWHGQVWYLLRSHSRSGGCPPWHWPREQTDTCVHGGREESGEPAQWRGGMGRECGRGTLLQSRQTRPLPLEDEEHGGVMCHARSARSARSWTLIYTFLETVGQSHRCGSRETKSRAGVEATGRSQKSVLKIAGDRGWGCEVRLQGSHF